jgi:formate-dependent nitrite reductase membrane component NrfD
MYICNRKNTRSIYIKTLIKNYIWVMEIQILFFFEFVGIFQLGGCDQILLLRQKASADSKMLKVLDGITLTNYSL